MEQSLKGCLKTRKGKLRFRLWDPGSDRNVKGGSNEQGQVDSFGHVILSK
jgi:hypothetical protein